VPAVAVPFWSLTAAPVRPTLAKAWIAPGFGADDRRRGLFSWTTHQQVPVLLIRRELDALGLSAVVVPGPTVTSTVPTLMLVRPLRGGGNPMLDDDHVNSGADVDSRVWTPEYDWPVRLIHGRRLSESVGQVGLRGAVVGRTRHPQEGRNGDGKQDGDDEQDHHELDQGETSFRCPPPSSSTPALSRRAAKHGLEHDILLHRQWLWRYIDLPDGSL
jgi:hypothetical protein